jgi:hypothetical protein
MGACQKFRARAARTAVRAGVTIARADAITPPGRNALLQAEAIEISERTQHRSRDRSASLENAAPGKCGSVHFAVA